MKNFSVFITLLVFLICPKSLLSQSPTIWYKEFRHLSSQNASSLNFTNDEVIFTTGRNIYMVDAFGNNFLRDFTPASNSLNILYSSLLGNNLFTIPSGLAVAGPKAYTPELISRDGTRQSFPVLDSSATTISDYPLTAVRVADSSFVFFGPRFFTRFTLKDDLSYDIVWKSAFSLGTVTDAVLIGNRIFAVSKDSTKNHYLTRLSFDNSVVNSTPIDEHVAISPVGNDFYLGGSHVGKAQVQRFSNDIVLRWSFSFPNDKIINQITSTPDGGCAVVGVSDSDSMMVARLDQSGNLLWRKTIGGNLFGLRIKPGLAGGFLVTGKKTIQIGFLLTIAEDGTYRLSSSNSTEIDVNEISAQANFFDIGDLNTIRYPKDSSTSLMSLPNFSATGRTPSGMLLGVLRSKQQLPFLPGSFLNQHKFFNRVWMIEKDVLMDFKADAADGTIDRPLHSSIKYWPARGNPWLYEQGESISISEDLAPFFDADGDALYNPHQGDYPLMKGDKMAWWVFNDYGGDLGVMSMGLTFKASMYAYNCDNSFELMGKTVFYEVEVENSSPIPLTDFRFGATTDFDLGCFIDDFVGTLASTQSVYAYNADVEDGNFPNCPPEFIFPNNQIPIASVTLLNQTLQNTIMQSNGSVGNTHPATHFPSNWVELERYLNGTWLDGTPQTDSGDGYNPGSGSVTNFGFSGAPNNPNEWSMCSENLDFRDIRVLMSFGKNVINPSEKIHVRYAISAHDGIPLPCPALNQMELEINQLRQFSDNGWFDLFSSDIWPEDTLFVEMPITLRLPEGGIYQWSTGDTGSELVVSTAGWYSVELTSPFGCSLIDSIYVSGETSSEKEIARLKSAFEIYPNPTSSSIFLTFTDELKNHKITIFDLQGRALFAQISSLSTIQISLDFLPKGMYLIEVQNVGQIQYQRVVKQ